jgi:hypothetical protein
MVGCGFKRLADLNADKVGNWLKTRRDESEGRFGVATSNHHLVAVKSFGNCLVKGLPILARKGAPATLRLPAYWGTQGRGAGSIDCPGRPLCGRTS